MPNYMQPKIYADFERLFGHRIRIGQRPLPPSHGGGCLRLAHCCLAAKLFRADLAICVV